MEKAMPHQLADNVGEFPSHAKDPGHHFPQKKIIVIHVDGTTVFDGEESMQSFVDDGALHIMGAGKMKRRAATFQPGFWSIYEILHVEDF